MWVLPSRPGTSWASRRPFRRRCRFQAAGAHAFGEEGEEFHALGADAGFLDGGEEEIAAVGFAGGVDVVEGAIGEELHGGEANPGLIHLVANVGHFQDGLL